MKIPNKFLYKLLRITGLTLIFREVIQKNKVTIVLFHDMSLDIAEQSFTYLQRHYNIISLNDFLVAVENKMALPRKSLILTFDDGHIGNFDLLPIIKRLNIPVTIFLCAGIINTKRNFWFRYEKRSQPKDYLKRIPNLQRVNFLKEDGFLHDKEFSAPYALQESHIQQMKPFINFQSHTLFHPILPMCTDKEAREEIFGSKTLLENRYHLDVNAISYPNGDYSNRDVELVKEAGYKCGVTVDFGFNTINTDLYRLKRFSVNDATGYSELIVKASGLWAFAKKFIASKPQFETSIKNTTK